MGADNSMTFRAIRMRPEVFREAKRLIRAGKFPSMHQLCKTALLQAASSQSILTPCTLAAFPLPRGTRSEKARTYLSHAQDQHVKSWFGRNAGSAAHVWVWLVANGVPAPGTAMIMEKYMHRGTNPKVW